MLIPYKTTKFLYMTFEVVRNFTYFSVTNKCFALPIIAVPKEKKNFNEKKKSIYKALK